MARMKAWEPIDPKAIAEEEDQLNISEGSEWVKIEEGKNVYRFLPRKKGWRSHLKTVHKHWVRGLPGRDKDFTFVCPRRHLGKQCPECDEADQMQRSTNPVDRDAAGDHWPRSQSVANVIDRSREGDGPLLLGCGKTIFNGLKDIQEDPDDGGDYTNPTEDGFDIIIYRKGKTKNDTEYKVSAARNNSPLSEDEDEMLEWIGAQWELDEVASCLDAAELLKTLKGGSSDRALRGGRRRATRELPPARSSRQTRRYEDDEEEDQPRRRRRRDSDDEPSRRKGRSKLPVPKGRARRSIRDDVDDYDED